MEVKTKFKIAGNFFLSVGSASVGAIWGTAKLDTLIDRTFQLISAVVIIGFAIFLLDKGEKK